MVLTAQHAIRLHGRTGRPLGDTGFVRRLERRLGRRLLPGAPGRPRKRRKQYTVPGIPTWDLDQDRAHNKVNEIDDIDGGSWVDPIYDAAGNTSIAGFPTGPNLWLIRNEDDWCCYTYDAWNRLVRVYRGARVFGGYLYDGLHRRIWRIVDGFDSPNRTDYYYNTSWQVLEERFYDGANPYTTVATDVTCQYVWDPRYIDAPVCRDKDADDDEDCTETDWDTGDDPDEHLYYCQDANFNTTALVERSDGSVVERYVYDPYGKVTIYDDDWSDTVAWGDSKKNEVLYCGYRYDHESRLYHVRYRSYHPTLGRWMQRDLIGYADGMNLYEYVASMPLGATDPMGLSVKIISRNKYPDEVSPVLGFGAYLGLGASAAGQAVTHYEDCCTEDGKRVEKGYVKVSIGVTVHAGLGIGAQAGGFGAAAKGAGMSVEYELSAETTTCRQPPNRYTASREENVVDARVDLSVNVGPFSVSFSGGTRVYLRLMGAIGGGGPIIFECDLCVESGARWGVQPGGQKKEGEEIYDGCVAVVRFIH